uniref:Uncharacterized protein n=1 Tax=Arundo donax TaxID=35708 RepID=A0A0A9SJB3_ARUDO
MARAWHPPVRRSPVARATHAPPS